MLLRSISTTNKNGHSSTLMRCRRSYGRGTLAWFVENAGKHITRRTHTAHFALTTAGSNTTSGAYGVPTAENVSSMYSRRFRTKNWHPTTTTVPMPAEKHISRTARSNDMAPKPANSAERHLSPPTSGFAPPNVSMRIKKPTTQPVRKTPRQKSKEIFL